jgi:SAM-dependent methyltransferase
MCPVCEGRTFTATCIAGLHLRRCRECGLRIGDFPASQETGYAHVDQNAYRDSLAVVRRAQSAAIVRWVREHVTAGEWLDVGCGYGFAVEAASNAGFHARGIEPNAIAADTARRRGIEVEHGLLTETTPAADVVSTFDVLEHVPDINAFAALVKTKARRLWAIKVPSSDGLFFRVAHALRVRSAVERLWQSRYEHPHRVYFDERALHRFLDKHGFDVVATHYLDEMPSRTVVDRLTLDAAIPRWKAHLAVPAVAVINGIEHLRARSDAMLVLAHPRSVL